MSPTRTYQVCNRLLNAEWNTHCEFDGYVFVSGGLWVCPACGGTRAEDRP